MLELAAALHHSAQPAGPVVEGPSEGEVLETYDAPRRLNALLPGKRPGVPLEPVAEGAAVTGGYVAAGAPLLVVPALHGEDSVDGTTVHFLPRRRKRRRRRGRELEEKAKEEKHEKETKVIIRKILDDLPFTQAGSAAWLQWQGVAPSSSRLPRTASLPRSVSGCRLRSTRKLDSYGRRLLVQFPSSSSGSTVDTCSHPLCSCSVSGCCLMITRFGCFWTVFYAPLVSDGHFSVAVSPEECRIWSVWETTSGLRLQRLRLDSGYTPLRRSVYFMLIFTFFYMKASSDFEVDSRFCVARGALAVTIWNVDIISRPCIWQSLVRIRRLSSTGMRSFLGVDFRSCFRFQYFVWLAVFPLVAGRPKMPASGSAARWWPRSSPSAAVALLLVFLSRCVPICCRQAQDARHLGR